MEKTFQSFVIDKLDNQDNEWDKMKMRIEREHFCKLPETVVIHFDQLSLGEMLMLQSAIAAMLAVYVNNRQRKAAGGN